MNRPIHLASISDLAGMFGPAATARHPLITVVDFSKVDGHVDNGRKVSADFYSVLFKSYGQNSIRYGRKTVDFHDGNLLCVAPNQAIEMDVDSAMPGELSGWGLFFHPDFIRSTSLHQKMPDYGFFSYDVSESLHLSEKEKRILTECIQKLDAELQENTDPYSQPILVSTLELLLNYCTRFYGRQFITRKSANSAVAAKIEHLLSAYFKRGNAEQAGLPTVRYLAEQVYLSPNYLSDLLKKETGKSAQDLIHYYLIEEAKTELLSTDDSIGRIAFALGFEYPQYFNRLFKKKTGLTPLEFRNLT